MTIPEIVLYSLLVFFVIVAVMLGVLGLGTVRELDADMRIQEYRINALETRVGLYDKSEVLGDEHEHRG